MYNKGIVMLANPTFIFDAKSFNVYYTYISSFQSQIKLINNKYTLLIHHSH